MPEEKTFTGVRIPYSDLTGTLDPHKVYETRAKQLAMRSTNGLERFAYLVFGPSLIGSLAFALNPYVAYEFPTMRITPVNRSRKVNTVPKVRRFSNVSSSQEICANHPDGDPAFPIGHRGPISCDRTTNPGSTPEGASQPSYNGFIADTTLRTRPLNSKGGEFEMFLPKLRIPSRQTVGTNDIRVVVSPNYPDPAYIQWFDQHDRYYSKLLSPWAYFNTSEFDKILAYERSSFTTVVDNYGLGVLADSLPTAKAFTLTRSIAELKDLPMLYKNTLELYKLNPSLRTSKGLGGQYLNFQFGWKPLVKDILTMLEIPAQITKEVNRLIDRRGVPTTFRAKKKMLDMGIQTLAGNSETLQNETFVSNGQISSRKWELRSAITYTLRFPSVDVPVLRSDLINQKWGLDPDPADVYNLVPWSWLVDWFSGLGQYVDLMNALAHDQSLFNYGYLTYVSEGEATGQAVWSRNNTRSVTHIDPSQVWSQNSTTKFSADLSVSYKYQKRIDISTLDGVKVLSRPSTLGAGQLAILGALLTKFASS